VEPKESVDKEKLAKAIIKVGNLQEKTPDEIARDIEPLISDEEKRYEKILESKNDSDINKSDLNLINKAYNANLDKDENFNQVNDVYETHMNRAVTHLVQNFLMSLVSGARERMQELKRMLHIRNEDRHLIRKAQQKQK
jgi:catalase